MNVEYICFRCGARFSVKRNTGDFVKVSKCAYCPVMARKVQTLAKKSDSHTRINYSSHTLAIILGLFFALLFFVSAFFNVKAEGSSLSFIGKAYPMENGRYEKVTNGWTFCTNTFDVGLCYYLPLDQQTRLIVGNSLVYNYNNNVNIGGFTNDITQLCLEMGKGFLVLSYTLNVSFGNPGLIFPYYYVNSGTVSRLSLTCEFNIIGEKQ